MSNPRPAIKPIILNPQSISAIPYEGFPEASTGGDVQWKWLLSSPKTPSNTFTSGIARCAPRGSHLKCHRHTHPEIYHIVKGRGIMSIDGKEERVEKGSVVFIPRDSEHGIRNEEEEEELVWLYVFAADGFGEVVYRYSESTGRTKAKL